MKSVAVNEIIENEVTPSIELEVYNTLRGEYQICLSKLDTIEIAMLTQSKDFGNAYKTLYQSHEDIKEG